MNGMKISIAILALLLASSIANAVNVSLPASKDTTIFSDSNLDSGGGAAGIFVGNNASGGTRRALIAFDLSSIPVGSVITSAQLTLYVGNAPSGSPNQTIGLYPLTANWGEGTTGSSNPNISGGGGGALAVGVDASWKNAFSPSTPWVTAGGDFSNTASATVGSIGATTNAAYAWSSAGIVSDLQGWLNNPATNFGWILRNVSESGTQTVRAFYSRESGTGASAALTTAYQPSLAITYVPEPATGVLFFAALMLMCTTRRRQLDNLVY